VLGDHAQPRVVFGWCCSRRAGSRHHHRCRNYRLRDRAGFVQ